MILSKFVDRIDYKTLILKREDGTEYYVIHTTVLGEEYYYQTEDKICIPTIKDFIALDIARDLLDTLKELPEPITSLRCEVDPKTSEIKDCLVGEYPVV